MPHPDRGLLETAVVNEHPRAIIVGADEVGRGCIAGPVYAACVALDYEKLHALPETSKKLFRDSKTLSARQRGIVLPVIQEVSLAVGIGIASVAEIETHNILQASFIAMRRALDEISLRPDLLLIDGKQPFPNYSGAQRAIVGGDSLCFCIAAASIVAKQARDEYMTSKAEEYPVYGFESHVGYGTKKHMDMISSHGICELHRRGFAPIKKALATHPSPTV